MQVERVIRTIVPVWPGFPCIRARGNLTGYGPYGWYLIRAGRARYALVSALLRPQSATPMATEAGGSYHVSVRIGRGYDDSRHARSVFWGRIWGQRGGVCHCPRRSVHVRMALRLACRAWSPIVIGPE